MLPAKPRATSLWPIRQRLKAGLQLVGVALRALGFFLAINQRLKVVVAFLTYIFEDRHCDSLTY